MSTSKASGSTPRVFALTRRHSILALSSGSIHNAANDLYEGKEMNVGGGGGRRDSAHETEVGGGCPLYIAPLPIPHLKKNL